MTTNATLQGKRVLIVMGAFRLGGAERQSLRLAEALRAQGIYVELWSLMNVLGRVVDHCRELGIPCRVVPMHLTWNRREMLAQLVRFTFELRRMRPDVLLPFTHAPNVFCGTVWRWTGARACVWGQRDMGTIGRLPGKLERFAARNVSCLISNSNAAADVISAELGVPRNRIAVVHNGIRLDAPRKTRAEWRKSLGIGTDAMVGCMVANLTPHKDHKTLLHAWRRVVDGNPGKSPVLLLAGHLAETAMELKALAFDLGLGDSVRFLGGVDDVAGLLSAADIGVFSSLNESMPNGILECMAAGLPVVATDIPGNCEALGQAAMPWVVPPGDADAMANRIGALIASPADRVRLGRENTERIRSEFGMEQMVARTVCVIQDAMVSSHSAGGDRK